VGSGNASLGFCAHDQGYDVFLGNFRGTKTKGHINPNITPQEYWAFTMNEHAFQDIPAFIKQIIEIKQQELHFENNVPEVPFKLSMISHSMGAGASLMYIVDSRLHHKPHHLTQAILLSPAGYHKDVPILMDVAGSSIDFMSKIAPSWAVLGIPTDHLQKLVTKMAMDAFNSGAISDLMLYFATKFVFGGDPLAHPLQRVPSLSYNLTGTSVMMCKHFWQIRSTNKFCAYDYGPEENLKLYGTPKPVDYLEHYDKIDIPIHFCIGLKDVLIPPTNVIHQYSILRRHHPNLAFLKASQAGHLEFTLGLDDNLLAYILEALKLERDGTVL